MAAAAILIALPMFGDYYTNDLLSRSPRTEMLGNQIDFYVNNSQQPQRGAVLVLILSALLLVALSWYLRSTSRYAKERVK
jgi:spermidine/putrescine transport system permease protein